MVLGAYTWALISLVNPSVNDQGLIEANQIVNKLLAANLFCRESAEYSASREIKRVTEPEQWLERFSNGVVTVVIEKRSRRVRSFSCDSPRDPDGPGMTGAEMLAMATKALSAFGNTGTKGEFVFRGGSLEMDKLYELGSFAVNKRIGDVEYDQSAHIDFNVQLRHLSHYRSDADFRDPESRPTSSAPESQSIFLALNFVTERAGVSFTECTPLETSIGYGGQFTVAAFDFRKPRQDRPFYFKNTAVWEYNSQGKVIGLWRVTLDAEGKVILGAERYPDSILYTLGSKSSAVKAGVKGVPKELVPTQILQGGRASLSVGEETVVPKNIDKSEPMLVQFKTVCARGWLQESGAIVVQVADSFRAWKTRKK